MRRGYQSLVRYGLLCPSVKSFFTDILNDVEQGLDSTNSAWIVKTGMYLFLYSIRLPLTCCFSPCVVAPSSTFYLGISHSASCIIIFLSLHILFLYYYHSFISQSFFTIIGGISSSVIPFCLSLFSFRPPLHLSWLQRPYYEIYTVFSPVLTTQSSI